MKKNNILLSIIIPVYNGQAHIKGLGESFSEIRSNSHIEFVFINDGSTDNSQTILNKLFKKNENVILINQLNQGLSISRNNGVIRSNGKGLGFFDCDDRLMNFDSLNNLLLLIPKIKEDIVHFRYVNYSGDKNKIKTYPHKILHNNKNFIYSLKNKNGMYMDTMPGNKLFRKSLFIDHQGLNTINEDIYFMIEILMSGKNIFFYNKTLYKHVDDVDNSIITSTNTSYIVNSTIKFIHSNENYISVAALILLTTKINNLNKEQLITFKKSFKKYKNLDIYKGFFADSLLKKIYYGLIKLKLTKILFFILKIRTKLISHKN